MCVHASRFAHRKCVLTVLDVWSGVLPDPSSMETDTNGVHSTAAPDADVEAVASTIDDTPAEEEQADNEAVDDGDGAEADADAAEPPADDGDGEAAAEEAADGDDQEDGGVTLPEDVKTRLLQLLADSKESIAMKKVCTSMVELLLSV